VGREQVKKFELVGQRLWSGHQPIRKPFAVTHDPFVAAKHAIDVEALCHGLGESAHPRTRRSGLSRCAQYSRPGESESEARRA
jgi:hypothetical protein